MPFVEVGCPDVSGDVLQQLGAGPLAASTDVRAYPAVLHAVLGVSLAFLGAKAAGLDAGPQLGSDECR